MLVIGAQFKVGFITENYSIPVSDIPVRVSLTPLQMGLALYRGDNDASGIVSATLMIARSTCSVVSLGLPLPS